MRLLKTRSFGDYFSDTFQFFKENFSGLILNFLKLQGILFVIIIVAMYFHMDNIMNQLGGDMYNMDTYPPDFSSISILLPILTCLIVGIISTVISANYIPIYMELYRAKQKDISFNDILEKFKEHSKRMILLTLVLILLFIPIYIFFAITLFISMFTIVGWILVIAFYISYFSQIWYYSHYYQSSSFQTLSETFNLYKDNFFKTTGATSLLIAMFTIAYYILLACVMLFASDDYSSEAISADPFNILFNNMVIYMVILQPILLVGGSIVSLLIQIQQGMIFYSRVNDIDQISEHEEIDSIGDKFDMNSFIKKH